MTLGDFPAHGVKGQGHRYINILKWLIISETVDILYTHMHYNIVRIDARYTLANICMSGQLPNKLLPFCIHMYITILCGLMQR